MLRPLKIAGLSAVIGVAGLLAAGCSKSQDQSSSEATQPAAEQSTQTAAAPACDRDCLNGMVDSYLAALVAHDPTKVPIADDYKFVENIHAMKVGEGLWTNATAVPTTFAIYVPDPVAEQVGFLGMMQQDNKPIELALRLKVVDGKITEMEHLIAANLSENNLKNLETPRPVFLADVPEADRNSRDDMLKIGETYYTALVTNNGEASPFDDADCERHENGMITVRPPSEKPADVTGRAAIGFLGCTQQISSGMFTYIKRIEPVRVWIADPETGLAFGLSQFRHPQDVKEETITGVPGIDKMPMNFDPFDLPAAHIFKIYDGKIHEIEAMGFTAPYNAPTGWETN
jgi:hypothetical protein